MFVGIFSRRSIGASDGGRGREGTGSTEFQHSGPNGWVRKGLEEKTFNTGVCSKASQSWSFCSFAAREQGLCCGSQTAGLAFSVQRLTQCLLRSKRASVRSVHWLFSQTASKAKRSSREPLNPGREGSGKRERARRSPNPREGWKAGKGLSPNPVREGEAGERGLDGAPTPVREREGGRERARRSPNPREGRGGPTLLKSITTKLVVESFSRSAKGKAHELPN